MKQRRRLDEVRGKPWSVCAVVVGSQPSIKNKIHQTTRSAVAIPTKIPTAGATTSTIVKISATVTVVPMFRLKRV
jgi:hypothetical protein